MEGAGRDMTGGLGWTEGGMRQRGGGGDGLCYRVIMVLRGEGVVWKSSWLADVWCKDVLHVIAVGHRHRAGWCSCCTCDAIHTQQRACDAV